MLYATPDEFRQLGLAPQAIVGVADADLTRVLSAASARAGGYLKRQFALPLSTWGDDLREAVCALAAWLFLCRRGFNPESGADTAVRMRHDDAIAWLERVADGRVIPDGVVQAPHDEFDGAAIVESDAPRGW